jgi:hypothetical protein
MSVAFVQSGAWSVSTERAWPIESANRHGSACCKFGDGAQLVKCNFCGKPPALVRKLIAGHGVYICNECVELCVEIIANESAGSELRVRNDRVGAPEPGDDETPPA